ncbi:MAG: hypothetical protein K8H86_02400 [Ignavibacteriaceae bacterium]|nr:hypothetical protein [Ignavibacteriaceae bacterium]
MRQILILMIVAGCCVSCNESDRTALSVTDYFPLQIDNSWTYSDGHNEWRVEVAGYKNIEGNNYAEVVRSYKLSTDTVYYRTDGDNKVYVYNHGQEFVVIDFEKLKDDSWESVNGYYEKISSIGGKFDSPAGKFENVVEIYSHNKQIADAFEIRKYAPGVGLIETTAFRKNSILISAFVNGVNYPQ